METTKAKITLYKKYKHAETGYIEDKNIAVITATADYIPIEEFKIIFNEAENLIQGQAIEKLIFDKRALRVFHQPSMEWYFIDWKDRMYAHGLKKHRKILPDDEIFRKSVEIGRNKILSENPSIKAHSMEIIYAGNLDDAIEN